MGSFVLAGVAELLGHDPLVALGLAVVAWHGGLGLLVAVRWPTMRAKSLER
jgi:hypothetical protein